MKKHTKEVIKKIEYYQRTIKNLDKILSTLEVQIEFDVYMFTSKLHRETKIEAIDYFLANGYSLKDAANFFDWSLEVTYRMQRYGMDGKVTGHTRKAILERDNNQCQRCHVSTPGLHIHHVGDPKSSRYDNLLTLCARCHRKVENEKIQVSA